MIIAKVMEGAGNQMFQYAFAKRLARDRRTALKLDIGWYQKQRNRRFVLHEFQIEETVAQPSEILPLTHPYQFNRVWGRMQNWLPYYWRSHVVEQNHRFDPNYLRARRNSYIEGYWQCERYFDTIADEIRQVFNRFAPADTGSQSMAQQIRVGQSVSLHVRRGDYATEPELREKHGLCGMDYYRAAVGYIRTQISHAVFYIFADDIEWAKSAFVWLEDAVPVRHADARSELSDLYLMKLCRHHITANSSFSWWGAWLDPRADKIAIAPKVWFADQSLDSTDIVPSTWIRL